MSTTTAVASHLNIAEALIAEVQSWANVLWVRFVSGRPRFVSKKVVAVEAKSVVFNHRFGDIKMTPINSAKMQVEKNGEVKEMAISSFSLTQLNIPARSQDSILFDLNQISGKGNQPKAQLVSLSQSSNVRKLNPEWVRYNNLANEGGEGYNPYPKYV